MPKLQFCFTDFLNEKNCNFKAFYLLPVKKLKALWKAFNSQMMNLKSYSCENETLFQDMHLKQYLQNSKLFSWTFQWVCDKFRIGRKDIQDTQETKIRAGAEDMQKGI